MDNLEYARQEDLAYANTRIEFFEETQRVDNQTMEYRVENVTARIDALQTSIEAVTNGIESTSYIHDKFWEIEKDVGEIKEVLIDIQDMLRRLGLDDARAKLGDVNLLLT